MATSDRRKGAGRGGSRSGGGPPCEDGNILKAVNHPLRREVLRFLQEGDEPISPSKAERGLGLVGKDRKANAVAYHASVLAKLGVIECVKEVQVRGAIEHFYVSRVGDIPWLREVLERTRESDEAAIRPQGGPRRRR